MELSDNAKQSRPAESVANSNRKLLGGGAVSLLDQAIVSGTNFVTTIIIGRAAGETELGLYSLGFTVVVLLLGAQEALITLPYTVFGQRIGLDQLARLKGTTLVHQAGFSLLISLALLFSGALMWTLMGDSGFARVLLILSVTSVLSSLRELVRRVAFADFQIGTAIKLDFMVCSVQLVGLLALMKLGGMTAVSVLGWIGVASGIATCAAILVHPPKLTIDLGLAKKTLGKHWRFGRWVLMGQIVGISNGYLMHWMLALMLGLAEAGVFAACLTLVSLANPIVIGIGNYLTPSYSNTAAATGNRSLRRPVLMVTLFMACCLSVVFLAVLFFGDELLQLLFGSQYAGYGQVTSVVAFSVLLRAVGTPPENGLRAMNRPYATFISQAVAFIVSLSSALLVIPSYTIVGAAYCMVAGDVAGDTVRWIQFWVYSSKETSE